MARITLDIFSGRPNPSWEVDDAEAAEILSEAQGAEDLVGGEDGGDGKLGFRGLIVEAGGDRVRGLGLPGRFRLSGDDPRGVEIADRILARLGTPQDRGDLAPGLARLEHLDLRRLVRESAELSSSGGSQDRSASADSGAATADGGGADTAAFSTQAVGAAAVVIGSDATSWSTLAQGSCSIEVAAFNPGFWNASGVITNNNCYNYATNRRTDTFAQPGRATGAQATTMKCANVAAGATSDGAHASPNCVTGEAPRWYMALVIWPGTDYHWYRKSQEGFWGHKPGQTAAKNTDNSGVVITNPETANRGGYRTFCGYFFARSGMVIQ
jgi:hypothetical protein